MDRKEKSQQTEARYKGGRAEDECERNETIPAREEIAFSKKTQNKKKVRKRKKEVECLQNDVGESVGFRCSKHKRRKTTNYQYVFSNPNRTKINKAIRTKRRTTKGGIRSRGRIRKRNVWR